MDQQGTPEIATEIDGVRMDDPRVAAIAAITEETVEDVWASAVTAWAETPGDRPEGATFDGMLTWGLEQTRVMEPLFAMAKALGLRPVEVIGITQAMG